MPRAYDLVSIGTAVLDMRFTLRETHVQQGMLLLPLGAKLETEDVRITLGGGAVTTALVAKAYGLKSGVHATLGTDWIGKRVRSMMREKRLTHTGARVEGESAFSIILPARHDRVIITHKGVGMNPLVKDPPKARAYYYTSPHPRALTAYAEHMREAKKQGIEVFFNPSYYLIQHHQDEIMRLLTHVDVLILNREEAFLLTGMHDMRQAAEVLGRRASSVVITNGPKQGIAWSLLGCWWFTPFTPRRIVDTTGAGDILGGTLATRLLQGRPLPEAVREAVAHATLSIQEMGAAESIRKPTTLRRHAKRVQLRACNE